MSILVHYGIESDNGVWAEMVPVCGYDFKRRKKLTDDFSGVTCRECLTLMGYEAVPVEQLTDVQPEPVRRAA
jgi:hypothetical protein